ncbi:hypothetical protein niasHS_001041 [Heterodera schachtii]|uniref:Uncharacterized protein n=1 Tax=Heterodera schachtii TaxID=97005 RepID=A0ABD2K8L9_HETSC
MQQEPSPPDSGSSSDSDSAPHPILISHGSLTLSQLVAAIESEQAQTIVEMFGILSNVQYKMPVGPPVPNMDRFYGRGNLRAEDVVYDLAATILTTNHGIIPLKVLYLGESPFLPLFDVNYQF